MSFFNLIGALLLLILGGLGVIYLSYFIIKPMLFLVRSSKAVATQSKKRQGLGDFIALIDSENLTEALSILPRVPFLESPNSSENFIFVRDHNQDFVTRCFFLFEKLGRPTTDIANLEMLFSERFELFSHLFKAQVNKKVLEEKHQTDKKKLPSWAREEFSNKERELNSSLAKNLREIELLLAQLSKHTPSEISTNMTIH